MFQRFTVKATATMKLLLCFGITLMEFGLAEAFCQGFDSLLLSSGTVFDRIMVRPRSLDPAGAGTED